ncbi:MAG: V4R domain-containing protein [Gemmatimonadales bacterium]
MTMAAESAASAGILFGKRALQQLHLVLERETGPKAANLLREIGFAAGEAAHEGFEQWCRQTYHVDSSRELDAAFLNEALSGFLSGAGWGTVRVSELAPNVLAVDGSPWAEARPQPAPAEYPSCHFSCGLLAEFFTRLGQSRAAVMEVGCGSRGEERCRFLVGSPDLLTYLYERMVSGVGYQEALGA